MSIDRRFDDVLMTMAGQAGSLEALLRIFFSFLHRQTDLYVTYDPSKTSRAGMGFTPGTAEKLLLRAFRAFPYKPYADNNSDTTSSSSGRSSGSSGSSSTNNNNSRTRANKTVTADVEKGLNSPHNGNTLPAASDSRAAAAVVSAPAVAAMANPPAAPTAAGNKATDKNNNDSSSASPDAIAHAESGTSILAPSFSIAPPPAAAVGEAAGGETAAMMDGTAGAIRVRYTEDGKQIPIGNGGVTPCYYWTQVGVSLLYIPQ